MIKKGDKIKATIPQNLFEKLDHQFNVGDWKYLQSVEVHTERRQTRHTKHIRRIIFNEDTIVKICETSDPNPFYNFESMESVLNHRFSNTNHAIGIFL